MVLFPAAKNNILARIDNDNDYDDYGDNFDDYVDENYQTPAKYHGFLVKIYSFKALLLS